MGDHWVYPAPGINGEMVGKYRLGRQQQALNATNDWRILNLTETEDWGGMCNSGHKQSPIDLAYGASIQGEFPDFKFIGYADPISNAQVTNNGHTSEYPRFLLLTIFNSLKYDETKSGHWTCNSKIYYMYTCSSNWRRSLQRNDTRGRWPGTEVCTRPNAFSLGIRTYRKLQFGRTWIDKCLINEINSCNYPFQTTSYREYVGEWKAICIRAAHGASR